MSVHDGDTRIAAGRTDRDTWFMIRPASMPVPRLRLICLPPAGAGVGAFNDWLKVTPAWLELALVKLPGRDARLREPLPGDLHRLVRTIRKQIPAVTEQDDVPYALFGHSMGGLLAYELAAALERVAARPPAVVFVSGFVTPDDIIAQVRIAREHDPVDLAGPIGGAADEILDRPELLQLFLPAAAADVSMLESYEPSHRVLGCPLVVFHGSADPFTAGAEVAAWARWTRGEFAVRTFSGGHHYPSEQPERVVSAVAELAQKHIER
jgi:surfactin synthase thioesterase subunit